MNIYENNYMYMHLEENFNFNEGEKNKYVDTTVLSTRRYNTPSRENIEEKSTLATETLPLLTFQQYHHHHVFPWLSFPHISATIKTCYYFKSQDSARVKPLIATTAARVRFLASACCRVSWWFPMCPQFLPPCMSTKHQHPCLLECFSYLCNRSKLNKKWFN